MPQPGPKPLTQKQARFVAAYSGNGTEAARLAGYTGSDNTLAQTARDLLRNPQISAAIKARESERTGGLIATREERQRFWTEVMRDQNNAGLSDRLRASELLGKSEADFTEKLAGADGGAINFQIIRKVAK